MTREKFLFGLFAVCCMVVVGVDRWLTTNFMVQLNSGLIRVTEQQADHLKVLTAERNEAIKKAVQFFKENQALETELAILKGEAT